MTDTPSPATLAGITPTWRGQPPQRVPIAHQPTPAWRTITDASIPHALTLPHPFRQPAAVATDASLDITATLAIWAVVHSDGRAWFGWYRAEATNTLSAELEAMAQGLATCDGGPTLLLTDAAEAAHIARGLADGLPLTATTRGALHLDSLARLKDQMSRRSVDIDVTPGPAKHTSPPGLVGVADQLAWSILRFLLDDVDPRSPAAWDWLTGPAVSRPAVRATLARRYRAWLRQPRAAPTAGDANPP
ncbi:hypothetical protein ACFFMN_23130 [Planobispora siamensis]|uniref:Uncharacterized protein n=1 Tax=Planobispora siamensis TaxID=936338 RepID=A0A8J3WLG1_9ACTN|nr:hypothetical protein [Planobispora siamensis]GIH95254.1 hypothetical protein Psi01_58840 [Planobispora siamensis]